MEETSVQRVLVAFVRRHAPHTYAEETENLRTHYRRLLATTRGANERRKIAQDYRQVRAAMVIMLARQIM